MAEICVNVYFKHEDPAIHERLVQLFRQEHATHDDATKQAFVDLAVEINPDKGDGIARAFLRDLEDKTREAFDFEEVEDLFGYCSAATTCGGGGDRFAGRCVKLLYHLCPGISALAWGMGDDDPWEFWFRHEDGHLVRHDDEPFDGYDNRIRSTIYRWWHEGLPEGIREGMLNDDDFGDEEEDEDDTPVSEEEYQRWLKQHEEGSDLEDDVQDVVMDEMVEAFTSALGSLFSGGATKKAVSADAFDCDALDEDAVRAVFDDMDASEKAFDVDGIMKHISKKMKGSVTTTVGGKETKMPLSHALYRMSLKLVLKEDADYESDQVITDISIDDEIARVTAKSDTVFLDPESSTRMAMETEDQFTLEIVDGKIQITGIESKELSSRAA